MIDRPLAGIDQREFRFVLKMGDHVFRYVTMPADQNVHMIRHDGTRVTDVAPIRDLAGERRADQGDVLIVQRANGMRENLVGIFQKLTKFVRWRLILLAAIVNFT